MITMSIDPNGEITISSETLQERAAMSQIYAATDGDKPAPALDETTMDELKSNWFKQGWEAAISECQINFVNGRLPEFFQELGRKDGSEDPHHDEPEGTGEAKGDDVPAAGWAEEQEAVHAANEIGLNVIRPVADSGEPEQEKNQTWDPEDTGTWTMSNEELQSRLDAAFERGREDGIASTKLVTTERALRIIAVEEDNRLRDAKVYAATDGRVGPTRGEVFGAFAIALAKRLGFEVQL